MFRGLYQDDVLRSFFEPAIPHVYTYNPPDTAKSSEERNCYAEAPKGKVSRKTSQKQKLGGVAKERLERLMGREEIRQEDGYWVTEE
jgi:hypothetical protein